MQETIDALKMVWATLQSLGWQPMPIVAAIIAMIAARSYWEPDILQVSTSEGVKRLGRIKFYISLAVSFVSFMLQVGLQKPSHSFDWCLAVGFTAVDVCVGYVVSSSAAVRKFLKNSLFNGGSVPAATIFFCSIVFLSACAKGPNQEPIRGMTLENGGIVMELPTSNTFDRRNLPSGVNPNDVAAIITLAEFPINTFHGKSSSVVFDKAKKPNAKRQIVVKKDGTVLAGEGAKEQIEKIEEVKSSYSWAWWLFILVICCVVAGWWFKKIPFLRR